MKAVLVVWVLVSPAQLGHASVHALEVPVVGAELFGGDLPVAVDHGTMRSGGHLRPGAAAVQQQVEVPPDVSQIVLQRNGVRGEGGEDQVPVRGDAVGPVEMPLGLVETRRGTAGNAHEVAAIVVGPVVVWTNEPARVTVFHLADPASSMRTNVRYGMELTLVVQAQEKRDCAGVGLNEITRATELAPVSQVQPTPGKYRCLFERKDGRVCKYSTADRPIAAVDEGSRHDLCKFQASAYGIIKRRIVPSPL